MVETPAVVLGAVPALALAGPLTTSLSRTLEATVGVGGVLAELPLTRAGLLAALAVLLAGMFLVATDGR